MQITLIGAGRDDRSWVPTQAASPGRGPGGPSRSYLHPRRL